MGYWEAVFYTMTMILDAGCISYVVEDVGGSGVVMVFICLSVVVIGMIMFTGAVIGYLTNYISGLIDHASSGSRKLEIHDHIVILNWNTRASEIVNDLLYCDTPKKVVILVKEGKEDIMQQINERMSDTVQQENALLAASVKDMPFLKRKLYVARHKFKNRVTVIIREGDTFSTKQLNDISLKRAKSIIILGSDINNTICKYEHYDRMSDRDKGNPLSVKTLVQVADITGAFDSDDDQKIVVEIDDDWTLEIVNKIIQNKQVKGKCNIIPVRINRVLGCILSQFSLMPELNHAYKDLFSNRGVTFYALEQEKEDEAEFIPQYLSQHIASIPLTIMERDGKHIGYYAAEFEKEIKRGGEVTVGDYKIELNDHYWMERKNVVILGHNSKIRDIMQGFSSFCDEWNYRDGGNIVQIVVIDDKKNLEKMNYYKEYPYVIRAVEADIFDKETICTTIEEFVDSNVEDTSILILSDDTVLNEEIDSSAITNLIYVQDIINRKKKADPDFDEGKILNPKHHDVITSYNINNVVISNRYVSKMITQLGENSALFDFYNDILTYDSADSTAYDSKEVYVKKVSRYFAKTPAPCTAAELIRAVYKASIDPALPPEQQNPAIVLGYVSRIHGVNLFTGDQSKIKIELTDSDKLILFSNH